VRTPDTASTFGGGALVLKSGGKLMLRTPAGATSTIPTLQTEAGATIYNGMVGVAQSLDIGTWNAVSGTTVLTTTTGAAGGSFDLRVHHLKGAGHITVGGNSIVRPIVNHGGQYTGTFTVNSNAVVTFDEPFGISGKLVVNTGANVTFNDWAYVTALTVNGVVKPLGIHTAASLGLAGSGSVVVCQPTAESPQMFGVNFAGAEFNDPFWQTNAAMWDYYQAKGLTLIRMPVKWSRIQSTLNGPVNFTQMDQCIALAAARGMKVIIDIHNYAAYVGGTNPPRLGSTGLPISAFTNVWSQIADHYKNNTAVYGYDLMNEPVGIDMSIWSDAAQQAVTAIRKTGAGQYVLVEGLAYSKATTWVPTSGTLNVTMDIKDPVGRLIYSAHSYWDYKDNPYASPAYYGSDGVYRSDDVPTPDIGVKHVKPFVEWLKTRPYAYGNVGEYCVPNNYYQAGWNEAMANFLQYLRDNNIGATYWAAGNNWIPSPTICHPQPFPGTDKPQMSVLELFNNN
jgi:endoglucanase